MQIRFLKNDNAMIYWCLPLLGLLFVALAIIGAMHHYSPVPYWDMWNSYIDFYSQVQEGHYSAFWAQHNEHRILISKLLFWLDLRYFHGLSWFLIGMNFVLMSLITLAFYKNTRLLFGNEWSRPKALTTAGLLAMVCFSWMQKENITWAFQSQFFVAFLFPLLAFQLMVLAARTTNENKRSPQYFAISILMGMMSLGTLACGILVLPLLVVMALVLRQSLNRIAVLTLIATMGIGLYLYHYVILEDHGSLSKIFHDSPVLFIRFIFAYLGVPFHSIFRKPHHLPELAGLVFVIAWSYSIFNYYKNKSANKHQLVFIFFIFYIVLVSILTALARANNGLYMAFAGRYTTPVLLAWTSLFILMMYQLKDYKNRAYIYMAIAIAIPSMFVVPQVSALENVQSLNHDKEVAALALMLNVHDFDAVGSIFVKNEAIFAIANKAKAQNLSIFALAKYNDAANALGKSSSQYHLTQCLASLYKVTKITGGDDVSKVSGLVNADHGIPKEIFMVDDNNKIIGVALTDRHRHHLTGLHYEAAFDGYIFGTSTSTGIRCLT